MKAIIKNATVNDKNEELINFAQSIDFTELFDHIRVFAGIECDFEQPEISTNRYGVSIDFASGDIVSQTGAFAAILEKCNIHSFSNKVLHSVKTGEIQYWVYVSIGYSHKDGGSNGMNVCRAWYKDSTGWTFEDAGA